MNTPYYQSQDLKKFKNISDWSPELGKKFFHYYNSVFEESALSAREKSLIALAEPILCNVPTVLMPIPRTVWSGG